MVRGDANFRINEVRKLTTPLTFGVFSNGGSGEITSGGYTKNLDGVVFDIATTNLDPEEFEAAARETTDRHGLLGGFPPAATASFTFHKPF